MLLGYALIVSSWGGPVYVQRTVAGAQDVMFGTLDHVNVALGKDGGAVIAINTDSDVDLGRRGGESLKVASEWYLHGADVEYV